MNPAWIPDNRANSQAQLNCDANLHKKEFYGLVFKLEKSSIQVELVEITKTVELNQVQLDSSGFVSKTVGKPLIET